MECEFSLHFKKKKVVCHYFNFLNSYGIHTEESVGLRGKPHQNPRKNTKTMADEPPAPAAMPPPPRLPPLVMGSQRPMHRKP